MVLRTSYTVYQNESCPTTQLSILANFVSKQLQTLAVFFVRSALDVVAGVSTTNRGSTLKFSIADVIRVFVTPSRTEQNAFWMNIHWKPEAVLLSHDREKKKYLQGYLYQRLHFSPLVVSCDGVLGNEAKEVLQNLGGHLARNQKALH